LIGAHAKILAQDLRGNTIKCCVEKALKIEPAKDQK
jgi:hypothetical protein